MDGAVELLKELLTIRSVNGRDDEGAVAEYLCKYFEQSGISAHIQRIDATHANVLAELEGESDDAPIFWNGHLDTVPYGDTGEWKTDPAVPVERDGFLYGRGASDMKSGLAAMVYALCEYKKSGRPVPHTIHFLGTCDEEKGGIGAREILKEVPETSIGTLLIGEPTGCRLGVAQKGCLWLEIEAHGKTSHGAYPQEGGAAAVEKLISQDFTAIFACNDASAYGVCRKLKEYRKKVPEDVSVVGYDDVFYARMLEVPLTTIRQQVREMGREAVRLLLKQIREHKRPESKVIFVPELVVRESTARIQPSR